MIEQLLDLRRIESGVLSLELARFDLAALLRRSAEAIQATTGRHTLSVEAPGELTVLAAPARSANHHRRPGRSPSRAGCGHQRETRASHA